MFTIRKQFKMEYAHQLADSYSVACQTLHGHSAILEVFLTSKDITEDSMIVDFGKIKSFVNEYIDSFDHALILKDTTPDEYVEMLKKYNDPGRIKLVPYNPTAEEMARDICQHIRKVLDVEWDKSDTVKLAVRFHETATGWAEYSEDIS